MILDVGLTFIIKLENFHFDIKVHVDTKPIHVDIKTLVDTKLVSRCSSQIRRHEGRLLEDMEHPTSALGKTLGGDLSQFWVGFECVLSESESRVGVPPAPALHPLPHRLTACMYDARIALSATEALSQGQANTSR